MNEESIVAIVCAVLSSGVLAAAVSGILNYFSTKKATKENRGAAIVTGLMVLLEDRINSHARKYIAQGFIFQDDKDRLYRMWEVYHTVLKGNGYLDGIMRMVSDLEVKIR